MGVGENARSAAVLDEAPADRYKKIVAMNVQLRRDLIEGPTYCRRCWTHNVHCVCAIIPTLDYPHRVVLVMHSKGPSQSGRAAGAGPGWTPRRCRSSWV